MSTQRTEKFKSNVKLKKKRKKRKVNALGDRQEYKS